MVAPPIAAGDRLSQTVRLGRRIEKNIAQVKPGPFEPAQMVWGCVKGAISSYL